MFAENIPEKDGSGPAGGSALNDAAGTVSPGGVLVAVQFDADGLLTLASPNSATAGVVINSGTIRAQGAATGGNGGDVYFDGQDPAGGTPPLDEPDPGTQSLTASGGTAGDFDGD